MLVTLKEHEILRDNFSTPAGTEYYAIPLAADDERVDGYRGWADSAYPKRTDYYQKLTEGPVYCLYPKQAKFRPSSATQMPIPAALLNVVDLEDRGTRLRLIAPVAYSDNQSLRDYANVGLEFWGTPTDPNYEDRGWRVLEGISDEYSIANSCCAPWDDNWTNPYAQVIGKVVSSGGVLPSAAVGYHVPLIHNTATGTYLLQHGEYRNHEVYASNIELPQTDKDREIFARKAHVAFQLQASPEVRSMLQNQSDGAPGCYFSYFSNDSWNNYNQFILGQNAPNYLAVDPADYKRVTFVPQGKVAGLLDKGKDPWTDTSRQSTTWGKLVKLFLNPAYCEDDPKVEAFSSKMVAQATDLYGPEDQKPELLIVRGAEIAKAYNKGEVTGVGANSSGAKSCMNSKPDSYFAVYTENPNQVAMLICRDRESSVLHGRALLWTDIHGNTFLDRRYVLNPVAEARMVKYATDLGYVDIWTGLSKAQPIKVDVKLDNPYHKHYPWIDSLQYFHPNTGMLHNQSTSGTVRVQTTGGVRTAGSGEVHCAQSEILAPKEKMEQTASGDYAFAQYVKTLRSGKKELEKRCVEDQLEGGLIASKESIRVAVGNGEYKETSSGNPGIALNAKAPMHVFTKEQMVLSPLDGGYIIKSEAVQQPDGGWCLPQTVAKYQAYIARKKVNKARRVTTLVQLEAVAELAAAA